MHTSRTSYIASKIRDGIAAGTWQQSGRLPPVRALARELECSPVTVLKALGLLVDEGLLRRVHGRGAYLLHNQNASPAPLATPAERESRSSQIASTLREQVFAGEYDSGVPLPQAKHFCQRYGCSHATLRLALEELCSDGLVEKRSTRWFLKTDTGEHRRNSSVYACGYPAIVEDHFDDVHTLLRSVETSLQRHRWGTLRYFLEDSHERHAKMLAQLPDRAPADHTVSGYILVKHQYRGGWKRFLLSKKSIQLVVVDFDQMAEFDSNTDPIANDINFAQQHGNCTIVMADNRQAGKTVGAHLASLGHRSIAFFTHAPIEDPDTTRVAWARLRYDGAREFFSPAGDSNCGIRVFDCSSKMWPPSADAGRETHERHVPGTLAVEAAEATARLEYAQRLALEMAPSFDEALSDRNITAWLCCDDLTAAVAGEYLKHDSSPRAARIALAGFDNSRLSQRQDFTSYDFAYDRIGSHAVSLLAYPSRSRSTSTIAHVEGQLVVRSTSIPASE